MFCHIVFHHVILCHVIFYCAYEITFRVLYHIIRSCNMKCDEMPTCDIIFTDVIWFVMLWIESQTSQNDINKCTHEKEFVYTNKHTGAHIDDHTYTPVDCSCRSTRQFLSSEALSAIRLFSIFAAERVEGFHVAWSPLVLAVRCR